MISRRNSRSVPPPQPIRGLQNGEELLDRQMTPFASGMRGPQGFGPDKSPDFGGGTSPVRTDYTIRPDDVGKVVLWTADGSVGIGERLGHAWTRVTADFVQPEIDHTVDVAVEDTRWVSVGAPLRIAHGTYKVESVNSLTSLTVRLITLDDVAPPPQPGATWDSGSWDDARRWDNGAAPGGTWDENGNVVWDDGTRHWDEED